MVEKTFCDLCGEDITERDYYQLTLTRYDAKGNEAEETARDYCIPCGFEVRKTALAKEARKP